MSPVWNIAEILPWNIVGILQEYYRKIFHEYCPEISLWNISGIMSWNIAIEGCWFVAMEYLTNVTIFLLYSREIFPSILLEHSVAMLQKIQLNIPVIFMEYNVLWGLYDPKICIHAHKNQSEPIRKIFQFVCWKSFEN